MTTCLSLASGEGPKLAGLMGWGVGTVVEVWLSKARGQVSGAASVQGEILVQVHPIWSGDYEEQAESAVGWWGEGGP